MRRIRGEVAFVFTIGLILIVGAFMVLFDKSDSHKVVKSVNDTIDISDTESEITLDKVTKLQEYYGNTDIKGIISIDNEDSFSYPVTQTFDNDYYLNHDYYKKWDAYGAIYADYRVDLDNSKKVLIFGHSSVKRNVPFNGLENYYSEDYYNKHKYITLETETKTSRYEIFSVYVETNDFTYMNINFDSDLEWYLHIKELQKKSMYLTDIELSMDDDILIMQTCSNNNDYQEYSKKYLLIVSRRVR